MGILRGILLNVAALAATFSFSQVPFTLDTTFRTELTQRNVNSILIREDGKVVASGIMRFPGDMSDRAGALFQQAGLRDLSFANVAYMGGKITPWTDRMYAGNGQAMRRLWLDGTLDASFNMVSAPYFSPIQGGDYHVYADGRVLFSGTHQLSDATHGFVGNYNLVWFSNQGYLDTTRVHKQSNGPINRFGQYLDGGFLCSGNVSMYEGQPVDKIFRVDSLGILDTNFHSHVYLGRAYAFLPLPDGRMYAAGTFWRTDAPPESLWLVRFMPDGSLDPTWTAPQLTVPQYLLDQDSNSASIFFLQQWGPVGSIVACGRFNSVNGQERWGVCVLDSTGQVLPPFENCRIDSTSSNNVIYCSVLGLAFTSDSQYVYVHGSYNGFNDGVINDPAQAFISRLHVGDIGMGTPDRTNDLGNIQVYPNPANASVTVQVEQLNSTALVIVRDALGREVLRQRIQERYTTLSLTTSGVYVVELWSGEQRISTQRLIVQ